MGRFLVSVLALCGRRRERGMTAMAACFAMVILSAHAAHAQVTYRYFGNPFSSFSCGSGIDTCPTPAPANPFTSYTATDFVSATLTFDDPLPPNLPLQNVGGRPGFALTIRDGQQSLTLGQPGVLGFVEVATGPAGEILLWDIVTGNSVSFAGIITTNETTIVRDSGKLAENNFAQSNSRGLWTTGPPVLCQIRLNRTAFSNGQTVTVPVVRFANFGATPIAFEYKVWIEVPTLTLHPVLRGGADGAAVMPAGVDVNIGPWTLFTVVPQVPRGSYAFSCRLLDPVTGQRLSESLQSFVVE